MTNKLVLYNMDLSPPCRTVQIVAKLIGVDLELRFIDLLADEHLKEPFIKLNPEHTVPTLIENDEFVVWDSHAISAYLVDKYAKDDKLYPKDLRLRAKCNQRLLFEAASVFRRFCDCDYPIFFRGASEVSQEKIDYIYKSLDTLEAFLTSDPFLVGNTLTIADISVAVTVLQQEVFAPLTADKHSKIMAWLKRVRGAAPAFDEINAENSKQLKELILKTKEANKQKQ